MSKEPRHLGAPLANSAERVYCSKCQTRQPTIKITEPPSTYATSKCLVCHPHLLGATDHGIPFRFEMLDRWELRRLIRVRDRNLGAELRVYLTKKSVEEQIDGLRKLLEAE